MSVEWQQELDQEWKWCHFFRGFDLSVWMLYLEFPEIQIFKPFLPLNWNRGLLHVFYDGCIIKPSNHGKNNKNLIKKLKEE